MRKILLYIDYANTPCQIPLFDLSGEGSRQGRRHLLSRAHPQATSAESLPCNCGPLSFVPAYALIRRFKRSKWRGRRRAIAKRSASKDNSRSRALGTPVPACFLCLSLRCSSSHVLALLSPRVFGYARNQSRPWVVHVPSAFTCRSGIFVSIKISSNEGERASGALLEDVLRTLYLVGAPGCSFSGEVRGEITTRLVKVH